MPCKRKYLRNPNYVRLYDLDDDTQERVAKEWAKETGIEPHYDEDGLWDNWEECLDGIIENWKSFTTKVDDYGNLIAEGEEPLFDKRTGKRVDNPEWTDTTRDLANRALGGGNDGILFKDVVDQGNAKWMRTFGERAANVFVALSPTQIKSATDNTGAFSAADPDIRHSVRSAWRPDFPKAVCMTTRASLMAKHGQRPPRPHREPRRKGRRGRRVDFVAGFEYTFTQQGNHR